MEAIVVLGVAVAALCATAGLPAWYGRRVPDVPLVARGLRHVSDAGTASVAVLADRRPERAAGQRTAA